MLVVKADCAELLSLPKTPSRPLGHYHCAIIGLCELTSLGKLARLAAKMSRFKDATSETLRTGPP